jgi:anti-sigma factor RsiW
MMHCTMDDLLALQANEGSVWAKQHLEACPACRAELEALYQRIAQLKVLPARRPARDRWPAVREAIRVRGRNRRRRWGLWSLAVAAGVAALIVFRPFWSGQVDPADLAQVKQQSATLESELSRVAPEGRVMSGREAAVASLLEDRIALVDGELVRLGLPEAAAPVGDVLDLWRERVDLMRQLYTVRVTRAAYVGL